MTSQTSTRTTGKTWIVILLAISLLFNMAAFGVGFRLWQARQEVAGLMDGEAASLPRNLQRPLAQALARHRAELQPLIAAVRSARAEAVAAATAEPLDRAALEAALDKLRGDVDALMARAQGIAVEALVAREGS